MEYLGYTLIVIGTFFGIANWVAGVNAILKKESTSFIPFIGFFLVVGGIFLSGNKVLSPYWPVSLIIEFTTLPMLVLFIAQNLQTKNEKT